MSHAYWIGTTVQWFDCEVYMFILLIVIIIVITITVWFMKQESEKQCSVTYAHNIIIWAGNAAKRCGVWEVYGGRVQPYYNNVRRGIHRAAAYALFPLVAVHCAPVAARRRGFPPCNVITVVLHDVKINHYFKTLNCSCTGIIVTLRFENAIVITVTTLPYDISVII